MHPTLKLKPKAGMRARAGAPWIYSNEIVMDAKAKALAPGALCDVQGDDGVFLGTGMFNPHSLISVRLLTLRERRTVDVNFFRERIDAALSVRARFFDKPFYRLINGEGDFLPGLIVDRFATVLSVQVNAAGMDALMPVWLPALVAAAEADAVVLRGDTPSRTLEGLPQTVTVAHGALEAPVAVVENGASFEADLLKGQKTGWYYDQRGWRAFMARLAPGQSVLDLYSYRGGFGVQAAMAGAMHVTMADSSEPALQAAVRAADGNGVGLRCSFEKNDVLDTLGGLGEKRFGIVIADPPPFVRSRKDLEPGAKAYAKLARAAAKVVAPGGFLFLASCSHAIPAERFLAECAHGIARAGRRGRLIASGGAGTDHPVHPHLPESAYLKALVFALD